MKKKYTTPHIATARLMTTDNIAQFIVSSHAVVRTKALPSVLPSLTKRSLTTIHGMKTTKI